MIIHRCIREDKVFDILKSWHDEPCGGHFAYKRIAYKILRLGYCWPTLFRDAKKYVKSCDNCKRMEKPIARDEIPLHPQVHMDPFEKWALDFVEIINPPSQGKRYMLICTYYVIKWVEAKALTRATKQSVVNFLFEEFFTRFGVSKEIVFDQGAQFTSNIVKGIIDKYKIKHCKSTPYHPQANGRVESTNKILEAIMTKTIQLNKKDWSCKLLEALWAYHTTWKNTTGFTPYEIVYGKKVLLPIKFQNHTFRLAVELGMDLNEAQQQRIVQLNELDEVR